MFAKAPVPGQVKTRLAATIGGEMAAALHAAFLADLAETVGALDVRRVLAWAGDAHHPGFQPHRRHEFEFVQQSGGDLGDRLDAAILAEATRSDSVLVVGSDSPTLNRGHFDAARESIEQGHDVVIGPSFDGGYYLIGVRSSWFLESRGDRDRHPLFDGIAWSTSTVLDQTLRRCEQISALCDLNAFWYDVDTFEDLNFLRTHLLEHLARKRTYTGRQTAALLRGWQQEGTLPQPGEGRFGDESEEE